MNEKRINILIDILNLCIYSYTCFCGLTIFFYAIGQSEDTAYLSLLVFPALIIAYIIRTLCRHLSVFLLLHLMLAFALSLVCRTGVFQILLFILGMLIGSVSLYQRLNVEHIEKGPASPLLLILVTVFYFISNLTGITFFQHYLIYGLILSALFYCLAHYLTNYRTYFITALAKTNVPMKQIRHTCHGFIALFLTLSGLFMSAMSKLPIQSLLQKIYSLIELPLHKIFSSTSHRMSETLGTDELMIPKRKKTVVLASKGSSSLFFVILNKVLYILLVLAVISAIIAAIIFFCYMINQRFYAGKGSSNTDHKEFISPFSIKKEKESVSKEYPQHTFFLFASTKDKMRRYFYYVLKPKVDSSKTACLTSSQITHSINESSSGLLKETHDEAELNKLHLLYDKARYSNEECTKEEYQQMKKIKI